MEGLTAPVDGGHTLSETHPSLITGKPPTFSSPAQTIMAPDIHRYETATEEDNYTLVQYGKKARTTPLRSTELKTVIIRPQSAMNLLQYKQHHIAIAVRQNALLTPHEAQDLSVHIKQQNNIIVIKTPSPMAAEKIATLSQLPLGQTVYRVQAYITAPANSCKGVIHGVDPGTTSEHLMQHLATFGPTILAARIMGKTETAIITFEGSTVPWKVLYHRAIFRCWPHHPKAQFCSLCLMYDHRADNCPTRSTTIRCADCTKQLKQQGEEHQCFLLCIHCGGEHRTNDPDCPIKKQKDQRRTKESYLQRIRLRNNTMIPQHQQPARAWGAHNQAPPPHQGPNYEHAFPALAPRGQPSQPWQGQLPRQDKHITSATMNNAPPPPPPASADATNRNQCTTPSKNQLSCLGAGKTAPPGKTGEPSTPAPLQQPETPNFNASPAHPPPIYAALPYQQHTKQANPPWSTHTIVSRLDKPDAIVACFDKLEQKLDRLTNSVDKLASTYERHELRLTLLEQRVDRMLKRLLPDEDWSADTMDYTLQSQKRHIPQDQEDTASTHSKNARVDSSCLK